MRLDTDIKDKLILLLGACEILGRAHVRILIKHNARLIIAGRPGSTVLEDANLLGILGLKIDARDETSMIAGIGCA